MAGSLLLLILLFLFFDLSGNKLAFHRILRDVFVSVIRGNSKKKQPFIPILSKTVVSFSFLFFFL